MKKRNHKAIRNVITVVVVLLFAVHLLVVFLTGFYLFSFGVVSLLFFAIIFFMMLNFVGRVVGSKFPLKEIKVSVVVIVLVLICTEMLMVFTGFYSTYQEKRDVFFYSCPYNDKGRNKYYILKRDHLLKSEEYKFMRVINSEGLADREHTPAKSVGEYRILALGDSLTEGDGAHADSTWLKFLERNLKKYPIQRNLTFMNAGVCGSDPFYSYVLLKDRLIRYKPDLVLLALNASDLNDLLIRGGMERFLPDGSVKYKNPP
jgi:hypothetical protein